MTEDLDSSPLDFRITRFLSGGKVRFIAQKKSTKYMPLGLSIYEAYLSRKTESHNSVSDTLYCLVFLYAWADKMKIDIDEMILNGEFLTPVQVNQFAFWLKNRGQRTNKNTHISNKVVNRILTYSSIYFRFFVSQYVHLNEIGIERAMKVENYNNYIKKEFSNHKIKERKQSVADDLSEEKIIKIEEYLRPKNRIIHDKKISENQAIRDYLFWRLAIEFGLREGEILSLRLEDLPSRQSNTIKIIRIEDRGKKYIDPRGKYAPRPKTLSRELGFILENSPIPTLINEYITKYRKRKVLKHGRKIYQWIMDQPAFLFLSHKHDKGNPLSLVAARDIAKNIKNATGIKFHWHLARHSFFNRAYAGLLSVKDNDPLHHDARLEDLVYWGGWQCTDSLQIYVTRAKRQRAVTALSIYGTRQKWEALNYE